MARNKQNDKAKKDGNRRKETKEEKKHRLKNAQGAREAFFKAVPYVLGAIVLFLIMFGVYVQSVPPRALVIKAAADDAFKLGPDGLPKFMTSETVDEDPKIVEPDVESVVSSLHDKSPHTEETLEL